MGRYDPLTLTRQYPLFSRRRFNTLAGGIFACGLPGVARPTDEGPALAVAVHRRPAGNDVATQTRMELVERGRAPRVRTLVVFRSKQRLGETANLIRFLEPADVAGTALLSIDRADGKSDQWLYLPAMDRVRRVAGDRKGGRFVGSELYFEDLQDRQPQRDQHRIVGKDVVEGVACDVLESVPIDAADSVYKKRLSWIDRATAMALRVDYFEHDAAAASKRWLLVSRRKDGAYWTVTDSRMLDLASGRETRLIVQAVLYDRGLPAKLFTPQALADESTELDYRP